MPYFTPDFLSYFRRLARNNRRDWYHEHKREYEEHVKRPFEEFVAEMIHRVGAVNPGVRHLTPRDAIFRIARDIRFSKDKTPYKPFASAVIVEGGRKHVNAAGLFFRFGADGVAIAGGMYAPDKDGLLAIRRALVRNGKAFARLLRGKRFTDAYGELRGERNKRVPAEFAEAAAQFPFVANKQFYFWAEHEPETILKRDLPAWMMKQYRAGQRVAEFLTGAVEDG